MKKAIHSKALLLIPFILVSGCIEKGPDKALLSTDSAPDIYKTEFENDYVRIVRVLYAPSQTSAMHSHVPFVGVTLTGQEGTVFKYRDGSSEAMPSTKPGELIYSSSPSTPHSVTAGSTKEEHVFVELKMPYEVKTSSVPNLVEVAPEIATVELQMPKFRVIRIRNPANGETPIHSHNAGVSIALTDIDVEVVSESGKPRRMTRLAGDALWQGPRGAHKGRNLSASTNEMLLIELL